MSDYSDGCPHPFDPRTRERDCCAAYTGGYSIGCAEADDAIFADRWRCAWQCVGFFIELTITVELPPKVLAEWLAKSAADIGASLPVRSMYVSFSAITEDPEVVVLRAQLTEARGLLERVLGELSLRYPDPVEMSDITEQARAWLAANKERK